MNYAVGLGIGASRTAPARRGWLATGLTLNLAALVLFKYAGFLATSVLDLAGWRLPGAAWMQGLALPLGISFYTFQAMSYIIDVYRKDVPAERNLLIVSNYIFMFPQLVAGPIVRFDEVRDALHGRQHSVGQFVHGMRIFALGLASKVLLANAVAAPADEIFGRDPATLSTAVAWFGAWCYTLQIYFDFMGYSVMAVGLGMAMAFRFPQNFNSPYVSVSITEFWRRWHISLSTWFRDYLYVPLGGNRRGAWRTYANLMIIFLFCGTWHGASWSFVVWGLYQGLFLIAERALRRPVELPLPRVLRRLYVMLAVIVGWIFFRCETLAGAIAYLRAMFTPHTGNGDLTVGLYATPYLVLMMLIASLIGLTDIKVSFAAFRQRMDRLLPPAGQAVLAGALCLALLAWSAANLASGTHNPFIYFRF